MQDLKQFARGSRWRDKIKVVLLSSGFSAVFLIRIQSFLYESNWLILSYWIHRLNLNQHGIDVLPGSIIDGGLHIEHPVGIVIGSQVKIGKNATILQGVTLGSSNVLENNLHIKQPKIGDNVVIGANSSILGPITIGNNARIGAHSLVLYSLPDGARFPNPRFD